ncbi:MAG: GNAT family N-acetyltransferase [Clostridia bacterium]|nr:GNAT family N-acetyltransferase [Clostridia bacterium]
MDEIRLVKPTMAYAEQILAVRQEILDTDTGEDAFAGCSSLQNHVTAESWLDHLRRFENPETVPAGYVPSSTYLAVRVADDRLVGIIDLRHHIDHPILSVWGGHIGYSVRPSERRRGYAKEMLRLNLENCRARGLEKVLITCIHGNIASEKTILANGGVFENEVTVDGEIIRRYWITL